MTDETAVPRPIDQITAELKAAREAHAAAQITLDQQGGLIAGLTREYRAAISWADQECKELENSFAGFLERVVSTL